MTVYSSAHTLYGLPGYWPRLEPDHITLGRGEKEEKSTRAHQRNQVTPMGVTRFRKDQIDLGIACLIPKTPPAHSQQSKETNSLPLSEPREVIYSEIGRCVT